ncbi:MAG: hypothetical protein DLM57_11835 [Pseudonocardiales bacterium]|nr:MAG: hypothetical protein DLM57_11835 [Pseudonocardiales bacterium]
MSSSEGPSPAAHAPAEPGLDAPADPDVHAPATASAHIAAGLAALDAVADLPLADHVDVYQRLHTELQAALAEIEGP